ncbi:MAG: sugar phosphate nucleotidyltransferase [Acidobacteriota bacterium]|nr:sugar phosphate nucleotidyltransferase [Acidobacteriota bacterium]
MNGMILAAGRGTRLYPLTAFRAKPAVPFLNRPLIQYSLDLLFQAGLTEIVINSHYLPRSISEALEFDDYATTYEISFSHEKKILGTGGAISNVRDFLGGDTFVVCNGKIYFEQNLEPIIHLHQEQDNLVTLVLVPHSGKDSYASVWVDGQNNITGFRSECAGKPFVFTGVHVLNPKILDLIPEGPSETVNDLYPRLIQEGYRVQAFVSDAYWCECSTPKNYLFKSLEVLKKRNLTNLVSRDVRFAGKNLIASPSTHIDPNCFLESSILWDNATVGHGSTLNQVIVTQGVNLQPHTHLKNAIVTPCSDDIHHESISARTVGDYRIFPL